MNRKQLIDKLASRLGTSKSNAELILETVADEIRQNLKSGEEVVIRELGTFKVKDVPARSFSSPLAKGVTEAKRKVVFKPSLELRALPAAA